MNDVNARNDVRVLEYQANKLQELISEVHNCCKDRFAHEAKAFKMPQAELRCLMLFEGHKYLTGIEIPGMLEVAKSRATVGEGHEVLCTSWAPSGAIQARNKSWAAQTSRGRSKIRATSRQPPM